MRLSLNGKRVVVTGAGGDIGSATRRLLEHRGARVAGIDLSGSEVFVADVTDRTEITDAITAVATQLGGIDILINNAGIGAAHDSGAFPDEMARRIMDVNFFGAWNTTAAAMPYLLSAGGRVVNISSGLALVDLPLTTAYTASKRSLDAFSAALSLEYAGRISVVSVHPGYIRTKIHRISDAQGVTLEGMVRADTVDQAAAAIVKACSTGRSNTTSFLSAIELGAARRFPRLTRRVIARRYRRNPQRLVSSEAVGR